MWHRLGQPSKINEKLYGTGELDIVLNIKFFTHLPSLLYVDIFIFSLKTEPNCYQRR